MRPSSPDTLSHYLHTGPDIIGELSGLGVPSAQLVLEELADAHQHACDPLPWLAYPTADVLGISPYAEHVEFDPAAVYEQARVAARKRLAMRNQQQTS